MYFLTIGNVLFGLPLLALYTTNVDLYNRQ